MNTLAATIPTRTAIVAASVTLVIGAFTGAAMQSIAAAPMQPPAIRPAVVTVLPLDRLTCPVINDADPRGYHGVTRLRGPCPPPPAAVNDIDPRGYHGR